MVRALCVIAGMWLMATGKTPFDLAGVHLSHNGSEVALSVMLLLGAMTTNRVSDRSVAPRFAVRLGP